VKFKRLDQDGSGVLDYSTFCDALNVDPSPSGEKLFKMFDFKKTGQVDMKEVR
jgi:Ca2+-binding EF-hand superfamily protein